MPNINFTNAEIEHIQYLIETTMHNGSYYGRKDYYDNRNKSILRKMEDSITLSPPYETTFDTIDKILERENKNE